MKRVRKWRGFSFGIDSVETAPESCIVWFADRSAGIVQLRNGYWRFDYFFYHGYGVPIYPQSFAGV